MDLGNSSLFLCEPLASILERQHRLEGYLREHLLCSQAADSFFPFAVHSSPVSMEDLSKRLATLTPTIERLMKVAGTPGLSLGVLH